MGRGVKRRYERANNVAPSSAIRLLLFVVVALIASIGPLAVGPSTSSAFAQTNPPVLRGFNAAVQIDARGHPVIAYTQTGSDAANQQLLLTKCADPACSQVPRVIKLATGAVGPVDFVLDADDNPVLIFRQVPDQTVQVLRCVDAACAAPPTVSDIGAGIGASLALTSTGLPVVAIANSEGTIRVVTCDDRACTGSSSRVPGQTVFPQGNCSTCLAPSLMLDSNDRPVVAYYLQGGGPTTPDVGLTLLQCGNRSCTSNNVRQVVEAGAFGNASLILDSADRAVLSYIDLNGGGLKLARCFDASCASPTVVTLEPSRPFGAGWPSEVRLDAGERPLVLSGDPINDSVNLFSCDVRDCAMSQRRRVSGSFSGFSASDSARASFGVRPDGTPFAAFVGETAAGFALQGVSCADSSCSLAAPTFVIDDGTSTERIIAGDATCDGVLNILDAFATAQYVVGLREGVGSCPIADSATQIGLDRVSVAGEQVTIQSAFRVSQCVVGLANELCRTP